MKVLVIDDEPLSRNLIKQFLRSETDVELIAEADNGLEAIEVFRAVRPDAIFLDIQMPGIDGLEFANQVLEREPAIVFITAFDQYAIRAFEIDAVDYLLKPFAAARFAESLERVRGRLRTRTATAAIRHIQELFQERTGASPETDRLLVKNGHDLTVLNTNEISRVSASDKYVLVHTEQKRYMIRQTINAIELALPKAVFARIHRSHIVNLSFVKELKASFNGDYLLILRDGIRLPLSRTYKAPLIKRFGM